MQRKSQRTLKLRRLKKEGEKLWCYLAMQKWGAQCNYCQKKPATCCHHFFRKSGYAHLRFNVENAVPTCQHCHLTYAETPFGVNQIYKQRGRAWEEYINEAAKLRNPKAATEAFIKREVERLRQEYEKKYGFAVK